jgi:hypothetical protein
VLRRSESITNPIGGPQTALGCEFPPGLAHGVRGAVELAVDDEADGERTGAAESAYH